MPAEPRSEGPSLRPKHYFVVLGVAAAYSAAAVAAEPRTLYTSVFTAIPGFAAILYAVRKGWHRTKRPGRPVHVDPAVLFGLAVWGLLIALFAAWVLATFFSHPRSTYPTLSSLMNTVFENYSLRAAGFLGWLALGWYMVRR